MLERVESPLNLISFMTENREEEKERETNTLAYPIRFLPVLNCSTARLVREKPSRTSQFHCTTIKGQNSVISPPTKMKSVPILKEVRLLYG